MKEAITCELKNSPILNLIKKSSTVFYSKNYDLVPLPLPLPLPDRPPLPTVTDRY
jgi:hypothetical protein